MSESFEYQPVSDALRRLYLTMDGSELQGIFCGLLASGKAFDRSDYLLELIGEQDPANLQAREDVALVTRLLGSVVTQLNDPLLQLQLLLPEEEALSQRFEALSSWCEGFLYGYGSALGGGALTGGDHEREFIEDLMAVTQTRFSGEEDGEGDEMDYIEVVEHIRIGTLLLYEENRPVESEASGSKVIH